MGCGGQTGQHEQIAGVDAFGDGDLDGLGIHTQILEVAAAAAGEFESFRLGH